MRLIPETDFKDFYESARFELTWRINLFLAVSLPFLTVTLYIFNLPAIVPTSIGWSFTIMNLVIMRFSKKYKPVSFIFGIVGVTLCVSTLIGLPESYHFVDLFWMFIITLYSYFTLGKIWGNIVLTINISAVVIFLLLILNHNIRMVAQLKPGELYSLSFNTIICGLIIAYLIQQFIKTNQFAEDKYIQLTTELQLKNEEKTVMLREIHHRVKNNLQVITSLLRLQSRETEDPKTLGLFKDSINRVVAMALIHDKMYQTKDLAKINLEEYLSTLLNDLIHSYSVEIPIKADIKSEVETISNKSLVPLALLFNELVSNSLKHAFHFLHEGRIKIIIDRETGSKNGLADKIILNYWDNGIWRDKQKDSSFGLELIETLTEQMDGTFKRNTKHGTTYEFILPDNL